MSSPDIERLNHLWHMVGNKLKTEMSSGKYPNIAGLSMVEMNILQVVEQNPKIIFKEICSQLGLPKSTLTSAVKRLEKRELVTRTTPQQDKRSYCLEFTSNGLQAQKEHVLIEHTVFAGLLQGLEKEEAETFIALLAKALQETPSAKV